jgi:hypothetical protein
MEILDALAQGGELEWYGRTPPRNATGKRLATPPVVVWRYKKPDEHREGVIQKAVESFKGDVDWVIYLGGRNWVITTRRLKDFLEQNKVRVDVEGMRMLAEQDPAFGQKANRELPKLAEHISQALGIRKK